MPMHEVQHRFTDHTAAMRLQLSSRQGRRHGDSTTYLAEAGAAPVATRMDTSEQLDSCRHHVTRAARWTITHAMLGPKHMSLSCSAC
jgi:hypothetical protein